MSTSSNTVVITDDTGLLTNITYIDGSVVYTDGETCDPPPSITKKGNVWTITLDCNRSGSSQVADKYVELLQKGSHMFADSQSSGDTPSKLNFYFGVNLQTSSASIPVYLAQGHYVGHNNWWFGSLAVTNIGGNKPVLLINGTNVALTGGNSSFTLSNI
ncbi:hypothetical protein MWMV17_MWMV17_00566 [Acinetobacter calcoaceticus]|uniref:Uncharacterized protein n=1 Tax=Acinetobacter calcoaceticus DSM 30006 = CIP 81.8 TaxID=981331 RepID=A0ABP2UEU6_ACICA|nr:hypothetical protein [Acinetobacter calcoaceticus]ENV98890.1 hypothetical protein F936_01973 [Acinetobacter calcoaceticus DSM 30006 = CIP 81.8]CAI3109350.1 hypothetical protein MWMV17_MWMV17_00566 [Acinetobacter calcoaceticus]SUU56132.1 Uncharacterised protein [Acinetobacter calcoaceticus]